jgi:excisionase family DNA binding protein
MSKPTTKKAAKKAVKKAAAKADRSRQMQLVRTKRAASAMGTVEDLAAALGIGRNQAYELVNEKKVLALRFGRRWLIPRVEIAKLVSGAGATVAAESAT